MEAASALGMNGSSLTESRAQEVSKSYLSEAVPSSPIEDYFFELWRFSIWYFAPRDYHLN